MTVDFSSEDDVSSTEAFQTTLGRVIRLAFESGIDPCGTWEYRTDGPELDIEVNVVELAE